MAAAGLRVVRTVVARRGNLVDHVETLSDLADDRVLRLKIAVLVDEEELAAVGVGPRVGHRHDTPAVCRTLADGQVLVGEPVRRAARTVANRVTTLQGTDARYEAVA